MPSQVNEMTRDLGAFVDTQECYDALIQADVNNDRRVTADEYVTVLQILGPPGFLENVTDFAELPYRIKTTFNALACLCTRQGETNDCCLGDNAHISTNGAAPGETPTPEQSAYLSTVCVATIRSITAVLEPTSEPSSAPSIRPSSIVPTVEPSVVPTELVPMPSSSPTSNPPTIMSVRPTATPSAAPSNTGDLPAPTVMPTEFVSIPSEIPASAMPSSSPTSSPPTTMSVPPTAKPSAAPSNPGNTSAPTTTPSPTQSSPIPIPVAYVIQVPNGENVPLTEQDIGNLEAAMDILAPLVADEVFNSNRRLRRRRLEVTVQLPTSIVGTIETGMLSE